MRTWSFSRSDCIVGSNNERRNIMKKSTEDRLTKLADAAFRQAAKKIIKRAKESGPPVVIWEDGEVKRVDARTIKMRRRKKNHD
jgi:hypothetical protein